MSVPFLFHASHLTAKLARFQKWAQGPIFQKASDISVLFLSGGAKFTGITHTGTVGTVLSELCYIVAVHHPSLGLLTPTHTQFRTKS